MANDDIREMRSLASRLMPKQANHFVFEKIPDENGWDVYEL